MFKPVRFLKIRKFYSTPNREFFVIGSKQNSSRPLQQDSSDMHLISLELHSNYFNTCF